MLILGLDVGTKATKGVLLRRKLFSLVPERTFVREFPAPPTGGDLAELVKEEAPGVEVIVMSIPRDVAITRNLLFPFKDLRKIKLVVPGEAERNLPFPLKDALVAHVIADPTPAAQTHVLAYVVNRRDLDAWKASLDGLVAPVKTGALDSLAAVAALVHEEPSAEPFALIDVGARKTAIEIVRNRRLVYSRSIGIGGDTFTAAIAAALKIEPSEADQLKRTLDGSPPDARTKKAVETVAETTRKLVRELKVTVLSARNTWPDLNLANARLVGGSARLHGLAGAIAAGLGTEVSVFAPKTLAPVRPESVDPVLVSAFGLALVGARQAAIEVDLLGRPRDFVRYHRSELAIGGVLLLGLFAWDFLSTRMQLASLRDETEQTEHAIKAGIAEIAKLTKLQVDRSTVKARSGQLQKLMEVLTEDCASRLALLNDVSRAIPEGTDVTLHGLTLEGGKATLEGATDSFETLQRLEESLKRGLNRTIEVRPPRNEKRDDRDLTIFSLTFSAQSPRDAKKPEGGKP